LEGIDAVQPGPTLSPRSTLSPASIAVREVAAVRPQDVAILVDDATVSFGELNSQADCLAQRLVREGVGGDRIALRANGTHATAVGFLAIQRAGMVSVPVDPTAPEERVRQILADIEAVVMLSDVAGDEHLPLLNGHPLTFGAAMDAVPIERERGELVSIVYTSGSTGTPKGIMVGREQMDETFLMLSHYGISPGSRLGGITAGTTGYIERLIGAAHFLKGSLLSYEIRRLGVAPVGPWLEREHVGAFVTVPTVLRHLLSTLSEDQRFPDLHTVVLGGEASSWEDVVRLRPHLPAQAKIVNAFGLTEAAGIASLFITSDMPAGEGPLPAGWVSSTARVTIVGEDGVPVAQGDPGEIVVEGPGCALGYWRRPDLTESVFTLMPSGYREVRTGDGGRIRADGMLEHLGRLDHVVKISGNRVELGEVEHSLARLDGVAAAAASTYTDETDHVRLTACVVARPGTTLDPYVVRASLSRRLPGYLIPDQIVIVDHLPQLAGGKIDRARVAELRNAMRAQESDSSRGRNPLEQSLVEIWCDVLSLKAVALDDDFFELGGDSIRAARLFVEIERRCGFDRPMSLLREAPTVASLTVALAGDTGWGSLLAVQTRGSRPPLFVVHDGTGSLSCGRAMAAALGPDQPLYGIRCEELNGQPVHARSLEALAGSYIERVKALYPHGPYILYGASMGGLIAIEMGRQLIAAGDEVPLIVLGDTMAPEELLPPQALTRRAAKRAGEIAALRGGARLRRLGELARRQLAHRVERAGSQARADRREVRILNRALARGEAVPVSARGQHVLRQYAGLRGDYAARPPFPEHVLLLRARGLGDVPDRGWGSLVGDALEIVDVPGSHPDLGRETCAAYVGPILAGALSQLP
jgi:acyl-coenzyme A synthetase/AMP-(fatty) acid ligase/thioesterase domain-containing protein/acyl carrier protein